jgi:hypothetical protein
MVRALQGQRAAKLMKRFRVPPQVVRLVVLTIAIVVAYFTARHFLVPDSFGKYGWYRADVLKDYAALPTTYAGAAACADCHSEQADLKAKHGHKSVSCESCHGPLGTHASDPSVAPPKIKDHSFCIRCHEANISRPAQFPQIVVADHAGDQNCTECHKPHQPKEAP